jgi:hypothetical protein
MMRRVRSAAGFLIARGAVCTWRGETWDYRSGGPESAVRVAERIDSYGYLAHPGVAALLALLVSAAFTLLLWWAARRWRG